jgi:transcriptional regulator with XRE-family HTH domain
VAQLTFGELLRRRLAVLELSQHDFAAKAGVSQSYVAQMVRGDGRMAAARIDGWVAVLGLKGAAAELFRTRALMTRCPEEIRNYIERLEEQARRVPRSLPAAFLHPRELRPGDE